MSNPIEKTTFQIRPCTSFTDFSACIELQREVWQFADLDITPLRALVITRHSGGMTLGAFELQTDQLLGFAHALPAFNAQLKPYLYSQMLAVKPTLQNAGIGLQLKFAQRQDMLARGLRFMTWTFDPLQSRNAYLNIVKLGAVVRKYAPNYYGHYSSSTLHQGLDTDRLIAEWWILDGRVSNAAAGLSHPAAIMNPVATVAVPFDIERIKAQDLSLAKQWQQNIRAAFQQHFAAGLYCAGFKRGTAETPSQYLFFPDLNPPSL